MSETPFVLGINPNYKKEGVAINSMPVNRPAFNSVINKNKNDKITFSEETKLISKNSKLKKYGIDLNKPFQVTPELIEKMKAKGPKGFFENLKDGAKNAIPFLSGAFEIKKNIDLLAIVKKQEKGKQLSAKEKELLYSHLLEQVENEHRGSTFMGQVASMLSHLPAFAGEFAATGGLYSLGKGLATKATTKIMGEVAKKQTAKVVTQKITEVAIGAAFRTPFVTNTYANITQRRLKLDINENNEVNLKENKESLGKSISKGLLDSYIENISEQSGALFGKITRPLQKVPVIGKLFGTNSKAQAFMAKAGFHGVGEEFFEERFGGVLRALTGLGDENKSTLRNLFDAILPSPKQAAAEITTSVIWGGALQNTNKILSKQNSLRDISNKNVADELIKYQEIINKEIEKYCPQKLQKISKVIFNSRIKKIIDNIATLDSNNLNSLINEDGEYEGTESANVILNKISSIDRKLIRQYISQKIKGVDIPPISQQNKELAEHIIFIEKNAAIFKALLDTWNIDLCINDKIVNKTKKIQNLIYTDYYLEKSNLPAEVIKKCKEFATEQNIHIFFTTSMSSKDMLDKVSEIEKEIKCWNDSFNKSIETIFIKPTIIQISNIKDLKISGTASVKNSISMQINANDNIRETLRHELTHTNSYYKTFNPAQNIFDHLLISEHKRAKAIMPSKNGVIDIEKCKYVEELAEAGIPLEQILYAYTSPKEFIAVAMCGDTSVYSKELKQLLISWGAQEKAFSLESIHKKRTNPTIIANIRKILSTYPAPKSQNQYFQKFNLNYLQNHNLETRNEIFEILSSCEEKYLEFIQTDKDVDTWTQFQANIKSLNQTNNQLTHKIIEFLKAETMTQNEFLALQQIINFVCRNNNNLRAINYSCDLTKNVIEFLKIAYNIDLQNHNNFKKYLNIITQINRFSKKQLNASEAKKLLQTFEKLSNDNIDIPEIITEEDIQLLNQYQEYYMQKNNNSIRNKNILTEKLKNVITAGTDKTSVTITPLTTNISNNDITHEINMHIDYSYLLQNISRNSVALETLKREINTMINTNKNFAEAFNGIHGILRFLDRNECVSAEGRINHFKANGILATYSNILQKEKTTIKTYGKSGFSVLCNEKSRIKNRINIGTEKDYTITTIYYFD